MAYSQRDFALAADAYRRALELDPGDGDIAWFAADAAARAAAQDGAPDAPGVDPPGAGDP